MSLAKKDKITQTIYEQVAVQRTTGSVTIGPYKKENTNTAVCPVCKKYLINFVGLCETCYSFGIQGVFSAGNAKAIYLTMKVWPVTQLKTKYILLSTLRPKVKLERPYGTQTLDSDISTEIKPDTFKVKARIYQKYVSPTEQLVTHEIYNPQTGKVLYTGLYREILTSVKKKYQKTEYEFDIEPLVTKKNK
jgi:hypothetical protein